MQKLHLNYSDGRKIFFTSDLHVGHRNILNFCHRPFLDVKDMSTDLVANWNRTVGENDIVFDLGDMFWFDSRHDIKKFVEKLNGKIYKIAGNHDMDCRRLFELCDPEKVQVCDDNVEVWIENVPCNPPRTVELWLSHLPQATWPHWTFGCLNLFGHIHSGPLSENAVDIPGKDLTLKPGQYDVGVDNNDFAPIELCDILKKLGVWEKKFKAAE